MPGESKFQYISELIKQDFTSGYYPFWNLSISDLSESSIEHIASPRVSQVGKL
jgi:hypothetical protein